MDEFLDQVIRTQSRIAIVPVSRTRLQFTLNACQAEFTSARLSEAVKPQNLPAGGRFLEAGTELQAQFYELSKAFGVPARN